jgi:DnaJ-domain-containing protein 1
MPDIFDRLGYFLRSLFNNEDDNREDDLHKKKFVDPDIQEGWDELEEYLSEGRNTPRKEHSSPKPDKPNPRQLHIKALQEKLREDYAQLKVNFATPFEEVKKAHKSLLRQYHPDRYANNPERFKMATEITQKINQSFQKIKSFEEEKEKI